MKKGRRGNLKSGTSKGRRQGNQRWWPQPQTLPETLSHIRAFHGIRTFRDDGPGGPSWRPSRESSYLPTQTPERQRRKEWGGGEKSTKDQGTTAQPMSKGATPPTNASNPTRTTLPNTRCRRLTDRKLRVAQVPAKKVKVPPIVRPTSRSQRGGNKAHTGVRSHNQQHLMPNNKKKIKKKAYRRTADPTMSEFLIRTGALARISCSITSSSVRASNVGTGARGKAKSPPLETNAFAASSAILFFVVVFLRTFRRCVAVPGAVDWPRATKSKAVDQLLDGVASVRSRASPFALLRGVVEWCG